VLLHPLVLFAAVRTDGYVTNMGANENWVLSNVATFFLWGGGGLVRLSLQDRKGVLLAIVKCENSVFCFADACSCLTVQLSHVTI
jgi:hypothetical protein